MFPKENPIRSKKLRNFARGKSCVRCERDDGTTVGAHLAPQGWCARGLKCGDDRIAHLCIVCHILFDAGPLRRNWDLRDTMVHRTLNRVMENPVMQAHYLSLLEERE